MRLFLSINYVRMPDLCAKPRGNRVKKFIVVCVSLLGLIGFAVNTTKAAEFSPEQKTAIQKIVHEYVVAHPEVLVEASQVLQQRQQQQMMQQANVAIKANRQQLFAGNSPVAGSPTAKVNMVEFFDYQCVHCREVAPMVKKIMDTNKTVRVIFKELPILGQDSVTASKAALAANLQGKYLALHDAMFKSQKSLSEEQILSLAKSVGLDVDKLKQDMNSTAVQAELQANMDLAQKIGVMGTPAFIIATNTQGDNMKVFFVPGAKSLGQMLSYIHQAQ